MDFFKPPTVAQWVFLNITRIVRICVHLDIYTYTRFMERNLSSDIGNFANYSLGFAKASAQLPLIESLRQAPVYPGEAN